MKPRRGRRLVLRIILTIAAVALVLQLAPLGDIARQLAGAQWPWVIAALLLQVLLRLVTAARMQLLAHFQQLRIGFWIMLKIVLATAFYGLFLPGGIAGGAVTFVKYRQFGASGAAALTNLFVNKAVAALTIGLLICTAWLIDLLPASDGNLTLPRLALIALALLVLLLLPSLLRLTVSAFGLAPRLQRRFASSKGRVVQAILAALSQLQLVRNLGWWQIFSLILAGCTAHLIAVAGMFCFGLALELTPAFSTVTWIFGVVFLLAMLPISFANFGVREASMILLLAPYGVGAAEATAWSILMYTGPLAAALAGAVVEAALHRSRDDRHECNVAIREQTVADPVTGATRKQLRQ
ncbi:lysylphosphatidylglycerol synthase transmembrane domain-containing protein [Allohahella sp. A8]|uniref:lysylphosphatidylglycerol synthase transmembrane domain-containing protein n=1 Tax=Allohahella sp. A8 TaxID=3141461 RepID=UPI003A7FCDEE